MAIASSKWRSPVQSGESPVEGGDRQLKVAIASSKRRSPVESGESPVQSGESPVQSGESPVQSGESPVEGGQSPVQSDDLQFKNIVLIAWPLMAIQRCKLSHLFRNTMFTFGSSSEFLSS